MIVAGDDGLQLRDRTVLGVLVVWRGRVVTVDRIAFALWGDERPASYRKVIQGSIVRLRRLLGPDGIRTVADGYQLGADALMIDSDEFEQQVTAARADLDEGRAQRAARTARSALAMWHGPPLAELDDWPPAEAERSRLQAVRDSTVDLLLEARLQAGHHREVADDVGRWVEESPYREERWLIWARALYATERQAEALEVLHRLRVTLRDDLGVDPSSSAGELELAILRHDAALDITPAVSVADACPWPGLLPYDSADAGFFAGRERDVEICLERLSIGGRLVIVAASGAGKSSLLRAGLVPRLSADGADVVVLTPGPYPLSALDDVPEDAVVVVDQAEEAITQSCDPAERDAFFSALVRRRGAVIVAARADLLDELAASVGFATLMESGLFVLRPLDEGGLRTAIEVPADRALLRLEPGLTELLLEECRNEAGALPMLSHVLAETWRRADGNMLTVDGYRESGGIRTAIAESAESVFQSLDVGEQLQMRGLFRRLVRLEGDQPVRTRLPREGVAHVLVERLVGARLLMVSDDGQLQVVHEQLVRHWPRLMTWVVEDRDGARLLQHLAEESQAWSRSGEMPDLLYRGVRLQAATTWADAHPDDLHDDELRFLRASQGAADAEVDRSRRSNRRLRVALVSSAVLLVLSAAGTVFALHQRGTAQRARDVAQEARAYSEALRIGSAAEAAHNPAVAFALVAEALNVDDSAESRVQALEVFGRFRALVSTGVPPSETDWPSNIPHEPVGTTTVSADGSLSATADGRRVLLADTSTGDLVAAIEDVPTAPNALQFDPAVRLLAGGLSEEGFADIGTTIVWNVDQLLEVARFDSGDGQVWAHRFGADGTSVYSFGADGLHRWDLTGSHALVRTGLGAPTTFRSGDLVLSIADDDVGPWVTDACRLAGRGLAVDEWRTYFGDAPYHPVC